MTQPQFIPGLELNDRFYWQAVRPLLDRYFPGLVHAAARIGYGSDVLGFDTPMSMDHDWGPKLIIFLLEADKDYTQPIHHMLGMQLPAAFSGFSTAFTPPDHEGTAVMDLQAERPLNHAVRITSLRDFTWAHLHWDPAKPLASADWLSLSSQTLREMTAGAVYHDEVGELAALRRQLAWYPHDIWLYLLACVWHRFGQEDHLMPRAGFVGDELGSALMGARLVRDMMTLCFLMEKVYPPYPKWFGSAFRQLDCAPNFLPVLEQILTARTWQERQAAFVEACVLAARLHNKLAVTPPLPEDPQSFHNRPFQVIGSDRFTKVLLEQITDPEVRSIAQLGLVGSVDLFSDSTDLRATVSWRPRLRQMLSPDSSPDE